MFKNVVVKKQPASYSSKVGARLLLMGIAMLTLGQTVGCNLGLHDTAMIAYRDMVWAKRAYNLRYANCDRSYAEHFENGFCAGYSSICDGGDGYVPALPPEDYRSYEYQSPDGAKCVNSWFEGYPAGVAAARKDKAGTYHDVLISRMINSAVQQSKTQAVLPDDVKVVSGSPNQVPVIQAPSTQQYIPMNDMPSVLQPGTYDAPPQATNTPLAMPLIEAEFAISSEILATPESEQPLPYETVPASWESDQP